MKLTMFDLRQLRTEPEPPAPKKKNAGEIAEENGIRRRSLYEWRRRHPDQRDLPPEEIVEIMLDNKRRWKK